MLAYDTLQPDTNGLATADTVDVYNGAPDHYEWQLLGKREMLVPYNSYAVHQKGIPYADILKTKTLNPELLRYEPHRVRGPAGSFHGPGDALADVVKTFCQ